VGEDRSNALVGRVLQDRYRLDELLATGGMGAVFRGMHLKMRKEIAIKILHPETENFPEMVLRFEREAVAGAHIAHPNVATASDMGTFDGGSYFLVQEFVRGQTLRELLDADAPLAPDRAVRIARQIALGLGALHDRGIIHRDLKPRNIMVTPRPAETVKIIDLGFAKVPLKKVAHTFEDEEPSNVSLPGVVFGSVAYMAPEIIAGMDAIDQRSDLYSLGILFYEMLTGQHPFDPCEPHEMLKRHRNEPPPRMGDRNPSAVVPPALEAIVMRLLDKDPARRYQVAAEVVQALGPLAPSPDEPSAPRAFESAPRSSAMRSSRNWVFALGGIAFVGLVAAVGLGLRAWRAHDAPAPATSSSAADASTAPSASATAPPVDIGA
jgi:serine/threonine-protein kinase